MISHPIQQLGSIKNYFVDEAGDTTLFNRRGRRILIGEKGCSNYFMLGLADIPNLSEINNELVSVRERILGDTYFRGVPSLQPEARKTAVAFHAKDDLPEIRKEVFDVLRRYHDIRFIATVRNKRAVLKYVEERNAIDSSYRYHPNELYDFMVRQLFKNLLHKDDQYRIVFATRYSTTRTKALQTALQAARDQFHRKWGILADSPIEVNEKRLSESTGLQVVDHFLWALQRLYEKGEERFLRYIWPSVRLVYDLDDKRRNKYGEYYNQNNPLSLGALTGGK